MIFWWLLPAAVCVSLGLTWALRRYALARRLVDVPNERSSHQVLTPRGGGVAIVLTFLACLVALWRLDILPLQSLVALSGAGGWVALIGFLDDHHHVPARWRLLAHFLGAAWALFWLRGMPPLTIAGFGLPPGWLINVIATVYIVWLLNLYNFMDGIDGIASIEAVTVCLGGILLYLMTVPGSTHWAAPAVLVASTIGFLYWNYPPAHMFMGDAGSGFLGMTLAVFSIQAAWVAPGLFWAWIIMLGVFVVDASVTLIRRIWRSQKVYEAHRSHAYQHAARRLGTHRPVSLAVGAINLVWLLPLALLVGLGYVDGALGLLIAYVPLVWVALHLKAGTDELQEN
jgi:Fuc2NAc and GlcNAc transferase